MFNERKAYNACEVLLLTVASLLKNLNRRIETERDRLRHVVQDNTLIQTNNSNNPTLSVNNDPYVQSLKQVRSTSLSLTTHTQEASPAYSWWGFSLVFEDLIYFNQQIIFNFHKMRGVFCHWVSTSQGFLAFLSFKLVNKVNEHWS